jgi:phage tail sheath protein FI
LLALQRALVRLAAARGDLLAVLSLPEHYREDKTLEHVALLKQIAGDRTNKSLPTATTIQGVPPFGGGETQVFSYAALYHPWLVGDGTSPADVPRSVPPDGAACGVLAQRALTRGAWVAPANELLRGVVALTPPVRRERWLDLQDAQLNLVRQGARGFLCLNADTLSDDDSLRLINVRRLLILLRRLALRHGATYVFEPNSDAFRRSVERGFSSLLDLMFARGAFAGATAATSYQVRADNTLNPPQSVEQGRFVVELRVAPSQPMTFMTIRLVQTGARGEVTEVA